MADEEVSFSALLSKSPRKWGGRLLLKNFL